MAELRVSRLGLYVRNIKAVEKAFQGWRALLTLRCLTREMVVGFEIWQCSILDSVARDAVSGEEMVSASCPDDVGRHVV